MKAVILAAGRGSRLKGFTDERPKCLNKVGSRTLIEYQLAALREAGIEDITIVVGYKGEMLDSFDCPVISNERWEKTNMVVSLLCAEDVFVKTPDPVIVSYSDIIYNADIVHILCHEKDSQDAYIVYDRDWEPLWRERFVDPFSDAESFMIDEQDRIIDIGRKVDDRGEIQGQYTGLMRFSQQAFSKIKEFLKQKSQSEVDSMDMTTLLRQLIEQGEAVYGVPMEGAWCEVDTIKDIEVAERFARQGLFKSRKSCLRQR